MTREELVSKLPAKDFVTLEDGYVRFWPSRNGCLSASEMRMIADELDARNATWDAQVQDYFSTAGGLTNADDA